MCYEVLWYFVYITRHNGDTMATHHQTTELPTQRWKEIADNGHITVREQHGGFAVLADVHLQ